MYEEGLFDTTKNSIQILVAGINRFRRLTPEDKAFLSSYEEECEREINSELKEQEAGRAELKAAEEREQNERAGKRKKKF